MRIASAYFDDYSRTLRRVLWAELIDQQLREARRKQFRASLVADPFVRQDPNTAPAVGEPDMPPETV